MLWTLLFTACTPEPAPEPPAWEAPACLRHVPPTIAGALEANALNELSGLVASRAQPGVWWAHNDSGDRPRLFALSDTGEHLGSTDLLGATAFDWEDLAQLPATPDEPARLYAGDIGDNAEIRADVTLWALDEPIAGAPDTTATPIRLRYPDQAHDAETLLADPIDQSLWILTKHEEGSTLFRADTEAGELIWAADLTFGEGELEGGGPLATAGDVSADGLWIALRTYAGAWVWPRDPARTLETAFENAPCRVDIVIERQGEAIAFAPDDRSLRTISEGQNAEILHYNAL